MKYRIETILVVTISHVIKSYEILIVSKFYLRIS